MQAYLRRRCTENAAHVKSLCGIDINVLDITDNSILGDSSPCAFRDRCTHKQCVSCDTHLYGSEESYRWNGEYIYFCPSGLLFIASPISDETGTMVGSFVAGPIVIGDPNDTISALPDTKMAEFVSKLPVMSAETVTHISSVLHATASFVSGILPGTAGSFIYEQKQLLDTIYSVREQHDNDFSYPIELEKELRSMIITRDKPGAQNILNELLGHIYFSNNYDFAAMKARIIELVVILSRSVIDSGADMREVFMLNNKYLCDIDRFTGFEEMNVWLTGITHRFIDYSFELPNMKHSDIVYRVTEYIKKNCTKKIALDDIAKHVYLSRSYISTIFKEETGESITDYIRSVRIEKSKLLLLDNKVRVVDIAGLCGFEDQSYFTKVFRRTVGITPKKFRDNRGRTPLMTLS